MRILLLSTYDLGHQPFGLASPAAWLRRAGFEVDCVDLSRGRLDESIVRGAALVAIYLPMHTATRLALPIVARVREWQPSATIAAYGLYAPLNAEALRAAGVNTIAGPESEADLVALAETIAAGAPAPAGDAARLPRLSFITPDRAGLPPLARYAALQMPDGTRRTAGYTEASRGCKHQCRHCPIVPIYNGHFRVVAPDVVLDDIRAQVRAGAVHITFGDPDFLNGPTHALRIVDALSREHPSLTYDAVIKIEHILKHGDVMRRLRETGCLFVTSAVESIDDRVLARLEKGHSRADFLAAVAFMREIDLPLAPTFVAFTPWTTTEGYLDLLDTISALDLVSHVPPIQLAIRLLLPEGSRLLADETIRPLITGFDARQLMHTWRHADAGVDDLQRAVMALVGRRITAPRAEVFAAVHRLARSATGHASPEGGESTAPHRARATIPYLNEPWYC